MPTVKTVGRKKRQKAVKSSSIRTIPSASELHRISQKRLVGFTTGEELHLALKNLLYIFYSLYINLSIPKVKNKTSAICKIIITGIPIINFLCKVLCLISFIVIYIATEPPKTDNHKSIASLVRQSPFFAANLSYTQNKTAKAFIKIR